MGKSVVNVGELEALVRPVPPTATVHWQKSHLDIPDKPARPMAEVTSKLDGHTEVHPALPDSEEWDAWIAEMQQWYEEAERIQEEHSHEQLEYHLDYAIVGWREAGSDDNWQKMPPEDWEPPDVLRRHNVPIPDDMRVAYLMYVVLDTPWKMNVVAEAAWRSSSDPERDVSPITEKEVSAVLDKFRGGDEDSGGDMGSSSRGRGKRSPNDRIRSRDVKGRGAGERSGLLVRLIPWL